MLANYLFDRAKMPKPVFNRMVVIAPSGVCDGFFFERAKGRLDWFAHCVTENGIVDVFKPPGLVERPPAELHSD